MDTRSLDAKLNTMIVGGKGMDAFEEFYDEDVVMDEPRTGVRKGKKANREFEKQFFDSIETVHKVELLGSACEADESFSEWRWDISFKDGSRVDMEEVAHRHWDKGRVVREKFFYNSRP